MNEPRCIAQLLRNESPRAIDFNITHGKGRIVLNSTQASFCTEYRVVTGGSDE